MPKKLTFVQEVEQRTSDPLWKVAERAAKKHYRNALHPADVREQKEYSYAMGYYHALKAKTR